MGEWPTIDKPHHKECHQQTEVVLFFIGKEEVRKDMATDTVCHHLGSHILATEVIRTDV